MNKEFEKNAILASLNNIVYDDNVVFEEVADNFGLKLYEFDRKTSEEDAFLTEEDIHTLFPDFVLKEGKGYIVGDDDRFYHR